MLLEVLVSSTCNLDALRAFRIPASPQGPKETQTLYSYVIHQIEQTKLDWAFCYLISAMLYALRTCLNTIMNCQSFRTFLMLSILNERQS